MLTTLFIERAKKRDKPYKLPDGGGLHLLIEPNGSKLWRFRTSASTILNERHFNPEVIEVALAHQDEDEVRRAYNRAKYWPEPLKTGPSWVDAGACGFMSGP
jgi:hypothetical protein